MIDIDAADLDILLDILRRNLPAGCAVFAFGSRVRGAARRYSDLDLLLEAAAPLPHETLFDVADQLEVSDISILVDIVDRHRIDDSFYRKIKGELEEVSLA